MRPKSSSSRLKYLFFSTYRQGSVSLPIVILNNSSLRKATCISTLQSVQLKGVRIRGTRAEESIFLYVDKSIPQEVTQIHAKNTTKPIQFAIICQYKPFHLHMCTFSEFVTSGQTSLHIIQREQCYDSKIYVETQLIMVYNGYWKRLVAILNKALIAC